MKKYFNLGIIFLVIIGGIIIIGNFFDDFENEEVKELNGIKYGVQYTSTKSSKVQFRGFVEAKSEGTVTIDHGIIFTYYSVFDQTGNKVKAVQNRGRNIPAIGIMTSLEPSERLFEREITTLELPQGTYTVRAQFNFDVIGNTEIEPSDIEVVINVE